MIYTVGNEQMYLNALKSGALIKHARSEKFPSAKVWETLEAAMACMEPEMSVFGVVADWENDTEPDENPEATWRHLKVDAPVRLCPEGHYFENKTPFRMGMTADHALQIIKRTFRKTKRAPENVKIDANGSLVVRWFLADCTLVFRIVEKRGPYVITGIRGKEPHPGVRNTNSPLSIPKPMERGVEQGLEA